MATSRDGQERFPLWKGFSSDFSWQPWGMKKCSFPVISGDKGSSYGEKAVELKNLPAHSSHLGLGKRGTESRAIWSRDLPDYPPWSSELSGQLDHAWRSGSSIENTPAYVSSTGRTKHHPKTHGSCYWSTYLCQKHKWGREYMAQRCAGKWEAVHMQGNTGLGERWETMWESYGKNHQRVKLKGQEKLTWSHISCLWDRRRVQEVFSKDLIGISNEHLNFEDLPIIL